MLIIRNIIITLLLLTLAAIAVVGFMVEMPAVLNWTPDRINALGRSVLTVMRPGLLLFLVWGVILLALFLVFLITVARPRKRMKIEVQMGGGRVVIMDAAIKKYIRNALSELGEVSVRKIDLREHRNLVTTDITADVRTRENLPVLERRIISRVRAALAEDLGITNLGDVHVFIRNFEVTGRPIKAAPTAAGKLDKSHQADRDVEEDEPTVAPINADMRELGRGFGAATGTAATGAAAGGLATGHLAEPVEPEGAAEPIIISDTDAVESGPRDSGYSDLNSGTSGSRDESVTESTIIAEKPLSSATETDSTTTEADTADDKDLDKPKTWGFSRSADDDRDPEDKGPLPL